MDTPLFRSLRVDHGEILVGHFQLSLGFADIHGHDGDDPRLSAVVEEIATGGPRAQPIREARIPPTPTPPVFPPTARAPVPRHFGSSHTLTWKMANFRRERWYSAKRSLAWRSDSAGVPHSTLERS